MGLFTRLDRLPDDSLLAAVGLGEADAAVVFVRRFQRKVYGLALLITSDAAMAEDVSQQAFERAWRHAGSYDRRKGTVVTWLMTITRNLAIDAIRVHRPRPVDPFELLELLPIGFSNDPAVAAVAGDDLARLRHQLVQLPEEQRRAVLLATIGGRTSAEIGQIENVPVPTAKTRLRTGLRKLRESMQETEA